MVKKKRKESFASVGTQLNDFRSSDRDVCLHDFQNSIARVPLLFDETN